jgi:Zn-dependent peptidase ImmA (M78 family)/transcriptional regulator with XRE-family HTH domain
MGDPVTGVNGKILTWARERSGLSVAQVAKATGRGVEEIEEWESDSPAAPTYAQLETLAYDVYKRPLALFFFPEPPAEDDPEHAFRTLPDFEIKDLSADTRYKMRHAQALQLALYDLHGATNPTPQKIFVDRRFHQGADPVAAAARVREYLGVTIEVQRAWHDDTEAAKAWRDRVEEKGIYVFKNSLKQKEVSGFCLYDEQFPVIYLNNSTAQTRQSFTTLHELGHILLGTSGVTKRNDKYIGSLAGEPRFVEVFCNQFAAECLLPTQQVRELFTGEISDDRVEAVAAEFKVSRQVVLTRLVNLRRITQAAYDQKMEQWQAEYDARKPKKGGGNYYLTQASYLGERFLRLAFSKYYTNAISIQQLADYLNVKTANVAGIEQTLLQGPAA